MYANIYDWVYIVYVFISEWYCKHFFLLFLLWHALVFEYFFFNIFFFFIFSLASFYSTTDSTCLKLNGFTCLKLIWIFLFSKQKEENDFKETSSCQNFTKKCFLLGLGHVQTSNGWPALEKKKLGQSAYVVGKVKMEFFF